MKYYLLWTSYKFDPEQLNEFKNENDLLTFINDRAGNPDFKFRAFRGEELKFTKVSVVMRYAYKFSTREGE